MVARHKFKPLWIHQAMRSSNQSSDGRLSDGCWCLNPAFDETTTTELVASQLAFDTPMLTAKGGARLGLAETVTLSAEIHVESAWGCPIFVKHFL